MNAEIKITSSLIEAFVYCPRQAWLLSRQLIGNQDDDNLGIGRWIAETSYNREQKEVSLSSGKADAITQKDGKTIVVEVKKSSKYLQTARFQVLFHLLKLKEQGVKAKGEIRVPKEKKTESVELSDENERLLNSFLEQINKTLDSDVLPPAEFATKCKKCSYIEFCFS